MSAQDAVAINQGLWGMVQAVFDWFVSILDATGMTVVYLVSLSLVLIGAYLLSDLFVDVAGSDQADAKKNSRKKR